jgi:hypothetical protein
MEDPRAKISKNSLVENDFVHQLDFQICKMSSAGNLLLLPAQIGLNKYH